jgi:hypothetical protein
MDGLNLIGDRSRTIEINADVIAVNTRKTKYMELRSHRGILANEHITICGNSNEKVKTFIYLGSVLSNKNSIHKEI